MHLGIANYPMMAFNGREGAVHPTRVFPQNSIFELSFCSRRLEGSLTAGSA